MLSLVLVGCCLSNSFPEKRCKDSAFFRFCKENAEVFYP